MSLMVCPQCGEPGTDVKQTRVKELGVTRTHVCKGEGAHRFSTVELPIGVLSRLADAEVSLEDDIRQAWTDVREANDA